MTAISGEDGEDREARKDQDAEGQHLAVDQGTEERPPQRAEPADDDDDERLDDDLDVHARQDALDRRHQRAAQPGEERAEREHAGVEPADIGAEGAEHLAVEGGGAHHAADVGAMEDEPEAAGDRRPQHHDEEVVVGTIAPNSSSAPARLGGRDTESCCVPQSILATSPRISTSA